MCKQVPVPNLPASVHEAGKSVEKADAIFSQERDPRFAEMFAGMGACKCPDGIEVLHVGLTVAAWPSRDSPRGDRAADSDPCSALPAEKKMMSSASAAGTQQIYSQGSPFPAGHSGKAFRYVAGGAEGAPRPGKPQAQSWALCAVPDHCLQAPGQAQDSGDSGSALHPPWVAIDTRCQLLSQM